MRLLTRAVLFCLAILTSFQLSFAQTNQFDGNWEGTANWGVQNFDLTIQLLQTEDSLSGEVFIQTKNKNRYAKYLVKGYIKDGVAIFIGTKYLAKKGMWCLPGIQLVPSGNLDLVGKWKSNPKKNGCLIAGVGKLTLSKTITGNEPNQVVASNRSISIGTNDSEGLTLVTELQKRKYYALLIAEQDYSDSNIVDLDQPVADALALRQELISHYSFDQGDVTYLKNPTRTELIETFDNLTNTVTNKDNLLIFYAGHGIWDDKIEQGYWLPSDAKKSSKAAWLSNGTIRDYIRAIDSKHTLLITDACFSGGILKTREAFTASRAIMEMYKLPSRRAITSGSLKTVPDKSVFIEYLLKALKNNEQPLISADQLFNSFKYNVINNSANGQVPQYGVISQSNDEGGDFIFLKMNK